MKRTGLAPLAISALAGWLSLVPAHAAPPTVIPSPGYDARLQEQRAAPRHRRRRSSNRPRRVAARRRTTELLDVVPANAGTHTA